MRQIRVRPTSLTLFQALGLLVEGTVIFDGDYNVAFDEGLDKAQPLGGHLTRPL